MQTDEERALKLAEMAENPFKYLRYIKKGNGNIGRAEAKKKRNRRANKLARVNRRLNIRRGK